MSLADLSEEQRNDLYETLLADKVAERRRAMFERILLAITPKVVEAKPTAADGSAPVPVRASTQPAGLGTTSATSSVTRGISHLLP